MLTKPLRCLPSRSQTNNLNDFFLSQRHWHRSKKTGDKLPENLWHEEFHGQFTCGANTAPHFPFTIRGSGTEMKKCGLHGLFKKLPRTKKAHEKPLSPLQWSLSKSEALAHRQCTLAHHLNVCLSKSAHSITPAALQSSLASLDTSHHVDHKSLDTAHNVPTFRHQLIEGSGITLLLHQKHTSVR